MKKTSTNKEYRKSKYFSQKPKSYFTQFILQKCNLKGNEV